MIYLVNENPLVTAHYKAMADAAGLPLHACENADDAFFILAPAQDIELVLVGNRLPIMPMNGPLNSIFACEDPALTGHALIKRLIDIRPDLPRERIVAFDRALNLKTARKTYSLVRDFGIVAAGSKVLDSSTLISGPGWNVRDHLATLDARR